MYDVYNVQYRDWETSLKDTVTASRRSLVDFLADAFYVAPITELALLHAAASPPLSSSTFFYVMNYSTDASSLDMLAYSLGAALTDGVDPFPTDIVYSPADKLLSEIVLNYWTNFIRTGYAISMLLIFLLSLLPKHFVCPQTDYLPFLDLILQTIIAGMM